MKISSGSKILGVTVIDQAASRSYSSRPNYHRKYWKVRCKCGSVVEKKEYDLMNHKHLYCRSCSQTKHGMAQDRFYLKYRSILNRCNNKKDRGYKYWGGKGIRCLWKNFQEFKKDMYSSYLECVDKHGNSRQNCTIGRIDNKGNYCKENCRWETIYEQNRNKSDTYVITFGGASKTMYGWSVHLGGSSSLVRDRIKSGWDHLRAVSTPVIKS